LSTSSEKRGRRGKRKIRQLNTGSVTRKKRNQSMTEENEQRGQGQRRSL
jgi:hypothetical protein